MSPRLPVRRVAAGLALGLFAACGRPSAPVPESSGAMGVTVQTVRSEAIRDTAVASGNVVPSAAADWTVFASDPAEIAELPKKAQDKVAAGDLLVRLDIASLTQELSALELAVLEAAARSDRAKAELARHTSLFERGLTSRNTYDEARLEQSAAETALVGARTRLESVKAGENRAVIRARFNGVVTEVFHNVGDQVRPGSDDPILRVVDPARVQVAVQLPLAELARIVPGQTATVQAIAGTVTEVATVASKSESVAAGTPTGEVRLTFSAPATLALNTPVSAEILLDQRSSALVVPASAVHRDDLGAFVMVADPSMVARRRDVRVGLITRRQAEIVNGLSAGERVITSSIHELADGSAITLSR